MERDPCVRFKFQQRLVRIEISIRAVNAFSRRVRIFGGATHQTAQCPGYRETRLADLQALFPKLIFA